MTHLCEVESNILCNPCSNEPFIRFDVVAFAITSKPIESRSRVKGVKIAVIYDKHRAYDRQTIESGIIRYEGYNHYRFDRIIVIGPTGNVHIHKHNDT